MSTARLKNFTVGAVLSLLLFLPVTARSAQEVAPPEGVTTSAVASSNEASIEALRAYVDLQARIHEARMAIDQTRHEAERAAQRNTEMFAEQMKLFTETVKAERAAVQQERTQDREALQSTGRFMLIVLSAFAAAGLLAVVLTAYFQWRTVGRLAQLSANWTPPQSAGLLPASEMGLNETRLLGSTAVDQSNERLTSVLERLERRIVELEQTARGHLPEANGSVPIPATSAVITPALSGEAGTATATSVAPPQPGEIDQLLERGQELLNEEKSEEALAIFDEALALDPNHTEALLKKGTALEKLRKPQEAIECYDRAIAADRTMTIAYLYKGGLFNRMERFSEAVECYEQALRTQESKVG